MRQQGDPWLGGLALAGQLHRMVWRCLIVCALPHVVSFTHALWVHPLLHLLVHPRDMWLDVLSHLRRDERSAAADGVRSGRLGDYGGGMQRIPSCGAREAPKGEGEHLLLHRLLHVAHQLPR